MKSKLIHRGFMIMVMFVCAFTTAQAADFTGDSSGIFTNPVGGPDNPAMVYTGLGTNHFTWGDADGFGTGPSSLTFTGVNFTGLFEQEFKFGHIDYFNGTVVLGTAADAVDLLTTLAFTDPSGVTRSFNFTLGLVTTPNTNDPLQSADYVFLNNAFDPTVFFSVNGIDYTLQFTRFGNPSAGGIVTVNQFHVLENQGASADLYGKLTAHPTQLPEPSTMLLFFGGMAGLAVLRKRIR